MTKQVKFGDTKKCQQVNTVEVEYKSGGCRRAVLLSSDDADRMAVESSRARLINHLVSKSRDHRVKGEFASYYLAPTRYREPPYSVTSHTNHTLYGMKALQVIPAYPSLVPAPQWCPYYRQMPEQNAETDSILSRNYNCRCADCQSPNCLARANCKLKPRRIRDNIMTFCDQCTMTPNLNDASCSPTPSVCCPGASVPCDATGLCGRKDLSKLKIHETGKLPTYTPVPILKKGHTADNNGCCRKKNLEEIHENEPAISISAQYFYRQEEDNGISCIQSTRKNLYNEGISDVVLKFPSVPKRRPCAPSTPVRSQASVSDGSTSDVAIPHSHWSHSRYHQHCAELPEQESKHRVLAPCPKITPCKICSRKRIKMLKRNIKLPKKVLTSEKVADVCTPKTKR